MIGGSRWAILAIAIGAIALDSALLGLIAPLLPEIERRTGASEAGLGLALAAYSIPILFVSVPFGRIADRVGRRPLLLAGLLLTVAGSILIAVSTSLAPLISGRAIQGIGSSASWIAALALVSDLAPPGRKGEAIGFALAANSGGAIGGPALGGVGGETVGYAAPFVLVAAIGLGLAAAGWRILPRAERVEASRGSVWGTLSRVLSRRAALPAALASIGGAGALGLIEVVVPLDADARLGLGAAAIGLLFAGAIALDAAAAPIAGRAGDRRGRGPVLSVSLLVLAGSAAALALLGGTAGLAIGLALFGVGTSALFAAAVPWLDDSFGGVDRGVAYGGLNVIYSVGYAAGPIAAGVLLEVGDADLAYWLLAAASLAGALALALAARYAGARPAPEG